MAFTNDKRQLAQYGVPWMGSKKEGCLLHRKQPPKKYSCLTYCFLRTMKYRQLRLFSPEQFDIGIVCATHLLYGVIIISSVIVTL